MTTYEPVAQGGARPSSGSPLRAAVPGFVRCSIFRQHRAQRVAQRAPLDITLYTSSNYRIELCTQIQSIKIIIFCDDDSKKSGVGKRIEILKHPSIPENLTVLLFVKSYFCCGLLVVRDSCFEESYLSAIGMLSNNYFLSS